MKVAKSQFLTVLLLIGSRLTAQSLELPVTEPAVFGAVDLGENGEIELLYKVDVLPDSTREDVIYVGYTIDPQGGSRALRATTNSIPFDLNQLISTNNPDYQFPNTTSTDLPLIGFEQHLVFPTWFYFDNAYALPEPFFTNKTQLLIGFRADFQGGRHYGWMSFSRPDTQFTTPFTLDDWDWNPVPNQPIKAGLPPDTPLTISLIDGGGVLRIIWPDSLATWNFESTTDLWDLGSWEAYPAGGTSVDVPLAPSGPSHYFRLRKPQ